MTLDDLDPDALVATLGELDGAQLAAALRALDDEDLDVIVADAPEIRDLDDAALATLILALGAEEVIA